ncbi:Uncharacterised protein g1010 [Pycnogonum litorale]
MSSRSSTTVLITMMIFIGHVQANEYIGHCENVYPQNIQCYSLKKVDALLEAMKKARDYVQESLYGRRAIDTIAISDSQLGDLPSDVFRDTNTKYLWIESSPIKNFVNRATGQAFEGIGPTMWYLRMADCRLRVDDWFDLSNLEALKSLTLSDNLITKVSNGLFNKPPKDLKELYLSGNEMASIADRAFSKLQNLETLELGDNRLKAITRSMFPMPAMKLKMLSLRNNEISYLTDDAFNAMPALREIHLSYNRLNQLRQQTWRLVWSQLHTIYLTGNKWSCTCDVMGWLLRPGMIDPKQQWISGTCDNPILTRGTRIEYVDSNVLACDLEGKLS